MSEANGITAAITLSTQRKGAHDYLERLEDLRFIAGRKNREDDQFWKLYDIADKRVKIFFNLVDILRYAIECDALEGIAQADGWGESSNAAFDQLVIGRRFAAKAYQAAKDYVE